MIKMFWEVALILFATLCVIWFYADDVGQSNHNIGQTPTHTQSTLNVDCLWRQSIPCGDRSAEMPSNE